MEKKLEEITIRKAQNGGHMIRHEYARRPVKRGGAMSGGIYSDRPPSEEHVFGPEDGGKVLAHVSKHLKLDGISTSDKTAEPTGQDEKA